jgi:hypothetical protein
MDAYCALVGKIVNRRGDGFRRCRDRADAARGRRSGNPALGIISFLRYRSSMPWTVETLNALVDKEIATLPADMRARFRPWLDPIIHFALTLNAPARRS